MCFDQIKVPFVGEQNYFIIVAVGFHQEVLRCWILSLFVMFVALIRDFIWDCRT